MLHDLWRAITAAMSSWHQGKLFVEHLLTISHDTLHLIVGLLVWLAIGLLTRRSLASWRPWLWLLVLILWNETVDLWIERWPDAGQQYGEGFKDLALTMAVPTIMMIVARLRPELFLHSGSRGRRR